MRDLTQALAIVFPYMRIFVGCVRTDVCNAFEDSERLLVLLSILRLNFST